LTDLDRLASIDARLREMDTSIDASLRDMDARLKTLEVSSAVRGSQEKIIDDRLKSIEELLRWMLKIFLAALFSGVAAFIIRGGLSGV